VQTTTAIGVAATPPPIGSAAVRVLVIAAWPPWPLTDGGSLVLHHHLRQLASRHEIKVLAAARAPGTSQPTNAAVQLPDSVDLRWFGAARRGWREYLRRRWASARTGEPADVFRVMVPPLLAAFDDAMATFRPDVVHLHAFSTAQFAARTGNVPSVHIAIDAWEAVLGAHASVPWWRRAIEVDQRAKVVRHEARYHPRCASVIVVASGDADLLRARSPEARIHVVPNGVDAGAPPAGLSAEPVLGFHGNLGATSNREAAFAVVRDVLPLVRARHASARALVVGRNPGPLAALAGPDVDVTGEVADVRASLEGVAVYVAPMRSGSGIKNKVLEAMAAGLPVVATPLALNGIGEGPGVFAAETTEELAARAADLLADPARAAAVGRAGRERVVRDFTWEASAAAVEALWEQAVLRR
jgi:glycosyltransferase involved in cell wall biosynthesis